MDEARNIVRFTKHCGATMPHLEHGMIKNALQLRHYSLHRQNHILAEYLNDTPILSCYYVSMRMLRRKLKTSV